MLDLKKLNKSLHISVRFTILSSLLGGICSFSSANWFGSSCWNLGRTRGAWLLLRNNWRLSFFELLISFLSICTNLRRRILIDLNCQLLSSLCISLSLLNEQLLLLQALYCCELAIFILLEQTSCNQKMHVFLKCLLVLHLFILANHLLFKFSKSSEFPFNLQFIFSFFKFCFSNLCFCSSWFS